MIKSARVDYYCNNIWSNIISIQLLVYLKLLLQITCYIIQYSKYKTQ